MTLTYNIEDSDYSVTGAKSFVDKGTEIDPTQRAARSDGRSPRAILTSTLSDELLLATNSKAKVFAVSVKDRGAVPMAGHGGKGFWQEFQLLGVSPWVVITVLIAFYLLFFVWFEKKGL